MGIQSQSALLFKSKEIKLDDIVYLLEQLHGERKRAEPQYLTERVRPKVTVDASLIAYKYLTSSLHPSDSVFLISTALAKRNIDVLIICDPPTRHHSKRAHHQRVGRKEINKLKLMLCRIELSRSGDDAEKIQQITQEIKKLEKAECRTSLPADFLIRLQQLHREYKSQMGKGEITIATAPFQADPSIADVALRGGCEAILSGDSDFAMYVGPGGPDMLGDIMLHDIKINQRLSTITSGTIITGQRNVATKITEILAHRESSAVFPTEPKYPLFDGVSNPRMRALIAIALGCDALPGGVPGIGAGTLHKLLSACNWNDPLGIHVELAAKLAVQQKALVTDPEALLCMANSLMYEKTNSVVGYMFDIPKTIEKYNEAFASPETQLVDGPPMLMCKGCDGQEHAFLQAETVSVCLSCQSNLCRFCNWVDVSAGCRQVLCLECKRRSISGDEHKSECEMRDFLKENSVSVTAAATYSQVLALYRRFNDNENAIFTDDIKNITYPLLPSSALHQLNESNNNNIGTIKTATVRQIGLIIGSDEVDAKMIVGLVHVLASLTDIEPRAKGEKLSAAHSIPKNLVHMAKNARIHTSQRLMERSLRHSTDRATPDILDGKITLGRVNANVCHGEVCVIIEHEVRASMKNTVYHAKSAITHRHFIATTCNCRAGCSNEPSPDIAPADIGKGRILCTHGMTLPVSLSLSLYRGLAAHVLSELRIRLLRQDFEAVLSTSALLVFREDVHRLMKAAGKSVTGVNSNHTTIIKSLDAFAVGTDLPKKAPSPPKPHDLGLLREKCRYEKQIKRAEEVILLKDEISNDNEPELHDIAVNLSETIEPTIDEDYLNGQLAIDALSLLFSRQEFESLIIPESVHSENTSEGDGINDDVDDDDDDDNDDDTIGICELPIGLELLRDRAQPHLLKFEYNERNSATTRVTEQWSMALLQWANVRGLHVNKFDKVEVTRKRRAKSDDGPLKKKYAHNYCCVCGRSNLEAELKRIGEYPPKLPERPSCQKQIKYWNKWFIRRECTERLGKTRDFEETNLRACTDHWEEVKGKSTTRMISQEDGTSVTESITIPTFSAPRWIGEKSFCSPAETMSKGNSADRATIRHVKELNELALSQQQILEMHDVTAGRQCLEHINPSILAAAGLDVHNKAKAQDNDAKDATRHNRDASREPVYSLKCLTPKFIKRRTGFRDLKLMLSYVAMICGGDMTKMTRTSSILTWLEEWMLIFELVWGRNILRFPEYATTYRCRPRTLRLVIQRKLQVILATRGRWPIYASFAEDVKFRDTKWNVHFDPTKGHRVVMHDSTNVPLASPTSAALQRALYNSYYGMCCAKAGVAVQLCGYIYGLPLNTGHSDDTRFIEDTDILAKQQHFAETDKSCQKPFLNIFDKGYQCVLSALSHGQDCLQPTFARVKSNSKTIQHFTLALSQSFDWAMSVL